MRIGSRAGSPLHSGVVINRLIRFRRQGCLLPGLKTELVEQKAVFGELTYQFSEQWAATLGARHFDYEADDT